MNITLKEKLTLTYTVDKCVYEEFNGTHTEEFDLSTLTSDDVEQYLAQTLVIKRQAMLRAKGAYDAESGAYKVKVGSWTVPAPGKRIATTPEKIAEKVSNLMNRLTPEQKVEIAKAMGFEYMGS